MHLAETSFNVMWSSARRSSATAGDSVDDGDVELGARGKSRHRDDDDDRVSIARKALVAAAFFDLISTPNEDQVVHNGDAAAAAVAETHAAASEVAPSSQARLQAGRRSNSDQERHDVGHASLSKSISKSALLRAHAQVRGDTNKL